MTHALLWPALVTLAFAVAGYVIKGVSPSGAMVGAVVCFTLYACAGASAFVALVLVFILTWIATRFGYSRKLQLGTAEPREGRNAWQVFANLGVATVCAFLYWNHHPVFLSAMCAALAEAAADTVSSELGQACGTRARLITTLQDVPAGTDGGVTLIGTLAGFAAAGIIGLTCAVMHLVAIHEALIVVVAAFAGTIADSLLGALLERRGYINNNLVNLSSTAVAAGVCILLTSLLKH